MGQDVEIKKSVCLWCKGECGMLVHVKDGHMVKVEPDPDWPIKVWPAAAGCIRHRAALEIFYHPDRVNFPLKRTGERGEGKWQRISWDQALDEIAEKLTHIKDTYGGETIGFARGTALRNDNNAQVRFLMLVGTVNNAEVGSI